VFLVPAGGRSEFESKAKVARKKEGVSVGFKVSNEKSLCRLNMLCSAIRRKVRFLFALCTSYGLIDSYAVSRRPTWALSLLSA